MNNTWKHDLGDAFMLTTDTRMKTLDLNDIINIPSNTVLVILDKMAEPDPAYVMLASGSRVVWTCHWLSRDLNSGFMVPLGEYDG